MTPAYRLWDPSQAVFFAFASFFARILSDVGYAAILGIASLALWTPMGRNKSGRGLRGVMLVLIIFSLACGGPGGNVLRGRAPRRVVACVGAPSRCQRSTLDDVDRDRHWSGASHLRQPGIRLLAPTFAHGDKRPRMGRHYSGRLQRGARNKLSRVNFPHRHWTVDVCRRRSAGTALYQRAAVEFVSGSVVWPVSGWRKKG